MIHDRIISFIDFQKCNGWDCVDELGELPELDGPDDLPAVSNNRNMDRELFILARTSRALASRSYHASTDCSRFSMERLNRFLISRSGTSLNLCKWGDGHIKL